MHFFSLSQDFNYPDDLIQRVYSQQVVLEHLFTRDLTAYGIIRVTNRAFDKQVSLRYTYDQWKNSLIVKTKYIRHYSENNTDVFHFKLFVPKEEFSWIMSVSFAICYRVNGEEFWDNNSSWNYTLHITTNRPKREQLTRDYQAIIHPYPQVKNLCGLKNLGGTCYMNSILQSLFLISTLTDYFLSNVQTKNSLLVNEYTNLVLLLAAGEFAVITPRPLQRIIGEREWAYLSGEQQDAHEFLLCLLDHLQQDLIENQSTIIHHLFYGMYRSTTTCLTCEQKSENFEPFLSLTVSIPSTDQCTLEECLAYLNTEEFLTDDSRWFCSSCQCIRNAKKHLEIFKFPKILIIQLKRFQFDIECRSTKNDTLVLYPEDNLHFPSSQSIYTLYSVINHHGTLNDGHYTTYSRNLSTNPSFWFHVDDEIINYLPNEQLNPNSNAYLLFYILQK